MRIKICQPYPNPLLASFLYIKIVSSVRRLQATECTITCKARCKGIGCISKPSPRGRTIPEQMHTVLKCIMSNFAGFSLQIQYANYIRLTFGVYLGLRCVYACIRFSALRLLITSEMIWHNMDPVWLVKPSSTTSLCQLQSVTLVDMTLEQNNVSINQPNKTKLALYKPLLSL